MGDSEGTSIAGVSLFSVGQGVLNSYPALRSNYVVFFGSNGLQPRISDVVMNALSNEGLDFVPRNFTAPILSSDNLLYTPNSISNLGNSAMVAETANVLDQYGSRVTNIGLDLSGVGGFGQNTYTLTNGFTIGVDQSYSVNSFFSGRTDYINEIKATNVLSATSGNLDQISNYGQALADNEAAVGGIRTAGGALEGVGGALVVGSLGYDAYTGVTTGNWSGLELNALTLGAYAVGGPVGYGLAVGAEQILTPTSTASDDTFTALYRKEALDAIGSIVETVPSEPIDADVDGNITMSSARSFLISPGFDFNQPVVSYPIASGALAQSYFSNLALGNQQPDTTAGATGSGIVGNSFGFGPNGLSTDGTGGSFVPPSLTNNPFSFLSPPPAPFGSFVPGSSGFLGNDIPPIATPDTPAAPPAAPAPVVSPPPPPDAPPVFVGGFDGGGSFGGGSYGPVVLDLAGQGHQDHAFVFVEQLLQPLGERQRLPAPHRLGGRG